MMKKTVAVCLLLTTCLQAHLFSFSEDLPKTHFVANFDYKLYSLNSETKHRLDSVVRFINTAKYAVKEIELYGHCDSIGSYGYNDVLSLKRVAAVKAYLSSGGIDGSLIKTTIGYGKRQPLNDNLDSLKRHDNRRVEVLIQWMSLAKNIRSADSLQTWEPVTIPDSAKRETIDLSQVQVNDIIQLKDINFYPDRHLIIEASMKNLKVLLNTMLLNKNLKIEIRGHVCCLPGYDGDAMDMDTYTEDLSLQRAREIYLYLSENGVARDRMTYVGLGGKYPLVKEFSDADKLKNRRVEIKILSK